MGRERHLNQLDDLQIYPRRLSIPIHSNNSFRINQSIKKKKKKRNRQIFSKERKKKIIFIITKLPISIINNIYRRTTKNRKYDSSNISRFLRANLRKFVKITILCLLCFSAQKFVPKIYMSPKIPANVFRRFFMVSSVSSLCDWLPCLWKGTLDVGASSWRRPTDGALLTVLDCDAGKRTSESVITTYVNTTKCD